MEIIGLIASLLIVFSSIFKTTTYKGTMAMRCLNTIGSIFFIIYGLILPAYSTAICNCCIFIINLYYIYKEHKDHKVLLNTDINSNPRP